MIPYSKEERLKNKERWIAKLRDWQESGLSGSAWCKDQGIKYSQFLYWKGRLFVESAPSSHREPFMEISDQHQSLTGVEVVVEGVSTNLSKEFDLATFQRCINVLKGM